MKLAIIFGPMCLAFRKTLGFTGHRQDPRGLSGSEIGFIRIAQELHALGHDVTAYTNADETEYEGINVRPLDARSEVDESFDACIAINEPDTLREVRSKLKVCEFWLNEFSFCRPGFERHVDLFVSPSDAHRAYHLAVEKPTATSQTGEIGPMYQADPANWVTIELGCDPWRYDNYGHCTSCKRSLHIRQFDHFKDIGEVWCSDRGIRFSVPPHTYYPAPIPFEKVPGRVVYCSSPDRGLHWVLQEWPAIKAAVPHATLKIFYRLRPWLDGFKTTKFYGPIEALRSRALYIEEALRRMQDPKWGITVCDSVSREQIEREMCEAEVLAYPVDTTQWSEGFSCTTIEACAARACPVLWDTDAIGSIYGFHCNVVPRGDIANWRECVIAALQYPTRRALFNKTARELAEKLTWKNHVLRLESCLTSRLASKTAAA